MEKIWFQEHSVFKKQESPTQPSNVDSYSFRGLFLVTGITSTVALVLSYVLTIKNEVTSDNITTQEPASLDHSISAIFVGSDLPHDDDISTDQGAENMNLSSDIDDANQLHIL